MSIKHWTIAERPREKLLERGSSALSDAELLAILLRVGTQGMSAVDMARSLLSQFNGLSGVMNAPFTELSQHRGMGLASFAQFSAVMEIGRRVLSEELRQLPVLDSPRTVADFLRLHIGYEPVEVSFALFLNAQNHLIMYQEISRGTVSENTVYVREVVKQALQYHATGVIFAHNHPSGHPEASPADHLFTKRLQAGLALMDIVLLDHFIVTTQETVSFTEQGWLNPNSDS